MTDNNKSFSTVDSDAESHSSDALDSWIELVASEKLATVSFLNVPSSFSKNKDISVKFKYNDFVSKHPEDFIGIYSILSNDVKTPLCKKFILLDEDCDTGSVSFSPNEIPAAINNGEYCFMYVYAEKCVFGISTSFVIEDYSGNENDAINIDSSEDDFIVISSQQLKTENDELRNLLKQLEEKLKQKEEQINTLTCCTSQLKGQVREDQATISNLQTTLDDTVILYDALVKRNQDLSLKMSHYDNYAKSHLPMEKEEEDEIKQIREALEKSESMLRAMEASKLLVLDELKEQKIRHEAAIWNLRCEKDTSIEKLEKSVQDSTKVIEELNVKVKEYEKNLEEMYNEIKVKMKNVVLRKKDEDLQYYVKRSIFTLNAINSDLESQLAESEQKIMDLEKEKIYVSHKLKNMQDEIVCKKATTAQNLQNSEAINGDLKKRLTDAAELYKQQFLTIRKLEKQVAHLKAKTGGPTEKMLPFITGDDHQNSPLFLKSAMDQQEKHSTEAKDKLIERKLPEKCAIYFSVNKELLQERDNEELKCDNSGKKQLNTEEEKIPKNATVPISDSDTGEYVSKRGPSYDSKLTDYRCAEAEASFWTDKDKVNGCSADSDKQNIVMKDSNNSYGFFDLESKKWKWTPCFRNFLLDDPANMPNVPLRPSAPLPHFCDEEGISREANKSDVGTSHVNSFDSIVSHTKDGFNYFSSLLPRSLLDAVNPTSEKWDKETLPFDCTNAHTASCNNPCVPQKLVPYSDAELQSAHCPFCEEIFYTIASDSSMSSTSCGYICSLEQLWDHLEVKHYKVVCPVCGALFDCQRNHEGFQRHVNAHL